jgi:hypothetical protein
MSQEPMALPVAMARYVEVMGDIPGWFSPFDAQVFAGIDQLQKNQGIHGDLLEIGVYHGRSAILLGYFGRPDERLVVCDVFSEPGDLTSEEAAAERATYFAGLRQEAFERNYARFHRQLPVILAMPSAQLGDHLENGSIRFVHIDGGHTHEEVRQDIALSRRLLGKGGIAAFDDWSQPHLPGVGLAIWEEYLRGEMRALMVTDGKLYATWDDDGLFPSDFEAWAVGQSDIDISSPHVLAGREVRRYTPAATSEEVQTGAGPSEPLRLRSLVRQVAPPVLGAAYRRSRRWWGRGKRA